MRQKYIQHIWLIGASPKSISEIEFHKKLATIETKRKAIRFVEDIFFSEELDQELERILHQHSESMLCIELVAEPQNRFFIVYPAPWRRGKMKVVFSEVLERNAVEQNSHLQPDPSAF